MYQPIQPPIGSRPKYHGPRDYQIAAESRDTPPDELVRLIASEYGFVRLSVACNKSLPPTSLPLLLPKTIRDEVDRYLCLVLASREDTPLEVLVELARRCQKVRRVGSANRMMVDIRVRLCCNPGIPVDYALAEISPRANNPLFRKAVAYKALSLPVLAALCEDPSPIVRLRASQRLAAVEA